MNLVLFIQIWKHSAVYIFQGCLALGLWKKIRGTSFFLKRIKETFFFKYANENEEFTSITKHSLSAF